jgi:mannose-1-phosphate guanylyltransferase
MMLVFHNRSGQLATIGVYQLSNPSRREIVQVNDSGLVRDLVEKPRAPCSDLAVSGLMLTTPSLLDVIQEATPVDLGFHVIPQMVGRMAAYRISKFLIRMATLKTYREAQMTWPGLSQSRKSA